MHEVVAAGPPPKGAQQPAADLPPLMSSHVDQRYRATAGANDDRFGPARDAGSDWPGIPKPRSSSSLPS